MPLACRPSMLSGRALAVLLAALMLPVPAVAVPDDRPRVMLVMARDQSYFFEAYDDLTDVDGDGLLDTSYNNGFDYYGYFHGRRCYRYDDGLKRFIVAGVANDHYCDGDLADAWSGNFLNWATMTRMDHVRRALYGGMRVVDTGSATVLERAHLPSDGHSFAKYYNGNDIARLTPYADIVSDGANGGNGNGVDDALEGITLCNTSYIGANQPSQTTTAPPMLRVARGNYALWASGDLWQCTWSDERGSNTNANVPAVSGIHAVDRDPLSAAVLGTPDGIRDHIVRVEACAVPFHDAADDPELCRNYPTGTLKPSGILQQYGETDTVQFGLFSGSWNRHRSGGVLRKAYGSLGDEINVDTDGSFKPAPTTGSIIRFLDQWRVWGYSYSDGRYFGAVSGDSCFFLGGDPGEGNCVAWGNPLSETLLEAVRHFAAIGAARVPSATFATDDSTRFVGMTPVPWTEDPVTTDTACAPFSLLTITGAGNSHDDDATQGAAELPDVVARTDAIGEFEGLVSSLILAGRNGAIANNHCTPKMLYQLGTVAGLCPHAPTERGTYHMAGVAHHSHVEDLRPDHAGIQTLDFYFAELPPVHGSITVPLPGGGNVSITPQHRTPFNDMNGRVMDLKVVQKPLEDPTAPGVYRARFHLTIDNLAYGADGDRDSSGVLDYLLDVRTEPAQLIVTTNALPVTNALFPELIGFVIEGTTEDGFHAYSGTLGANHVDHYPGVPGCVNCQVSDASSGQRGPQSHTFVVAEPTYAPTLQRPAWYAAKWGGFIDNNGSGTPDAHEEWDAVDQEGADTPDNQPDNYAALAGSGLLHGQLDRWLARIVEQGPRDCPVPIDSDVDGIPDAADNCPQTANSNQRDTDGDGYGNVCDADLNNDGVVNVVDLARFKFVFGQSDADADFNGDGIVNVVDLALLKSLFGQRLY